MLLHITAIREVQLEAKYADAVVRGYSHTIRQYLGYMDIKRPSEFLQDAEDVLREAAVGSLDVTLTVYPVQTVQPIDWFQITAPRCFPVSLGAQRSAPRPI
jgi:hypothetical protein